MLLSNKVKILKKNVKDKNIKILIFINIVFLTTRNDIIFFFQKHLYIFEIMSVQ